MYNTSLTLSWWEHYLWLLKHCRIIRLVILLCTSNIDVRTMHALYLFNVIMHCSLCLYIVQVRPGLFQMAMRLLNPSSVVQASIPSIFKNVPESYLASTMDVFENNAKTSYSVFSSIPGLTPVMPAGSMYIMVRA